MYENIRLQTSRLLLRPVSPDDLSTVYAYSSDGEHVKYMKYYPIYGSVQKVSHTDLPRME